MDSELGHGTTFVVELPREQPSLSAGNGVESMA
jgi:signal transduction histidine kinase